MRNKPREEWHNYEPSRELRVGEVEVAISINRDTAKKFLDYLSDRVERGTGIRFKLLSSGAFEIARKKDGESLICQAWSTDPYIFPNVSAHTDRYDSRYNRLEIYIPTDKCAELAKWLNQ